MKSNSTRPMQASVKRLEILSLINSTLSLFLEIKKSKVKLLKSEQEKEIN